MALPVTECHRTIKIGSIATQEDKVTAIATHRHCRKACDPQGRRMRSRSDGTSYSTLVEKKEPPGLLQNRPLGGVRNNPNPFRLLSRSSAPDGLSQMASCVFPFYEFFLSFFHRWHTASRSLNDAVAHQKIISCQTEKCPLLDT